MGVLDSLVIDIPNFVAYLDMLYEKVQGDVKIAQVVELLLLLRGTNHCTIQSMIHDRCFSVWSFEKLLRSLFEKSEARLVAKLTAHSTGPIRFIQQNDVSKAKQSAEATAIVVPGL